MCVDAGLRQSFPHCFRSGGQRGLVEDRDGASARECLDDVAEQSTSDDNRVRLGSFDVDAYRFGHGVLLRFSSLVVVFESSWAGSSLARTCWTTRPGLRPSVRTRIVADFR